MAQGVLVVPVPAWGVPTRLAVRKALRRRATRLRRGLPVQRLRINELKGDMRGRGRVRHHRGVVLDGELTEGDDVRAPLPWRRVRLRLGGASGRLAPGVEDRDVRPVLGPVAAHGRDHERVRVARLTGGGPEGAVQDKLLAEFREVVRRIRDDGQIPGGGEGVPVGPHRLRLDLHGVDRHPVAPADDHRHRRRPARRAPSSGTSSTSAQETSSGVAARAFVRGWGWTFVLCRARVAVPVAQAPLNSAPPNACDCDPA